MVFQIGKVSNSPNSGAVIFLIRCDKIRYEVIVFDGVGAAILLKNFVKTSLVRSYSSKLDCDAHFARL